MNTQGFLIEGFLFTVTIKLDALKMIYRFNRGAAEQTKWLNNW